MVQDQDYSDLQGRDYIASVQSPEQKEDLSQHQIFRPLYVEGPYTLWLKTTVQSYYVLRTDPMELQEPLMYERGMNKINCNCISKPLKTYVTPIIRFNYYSAHAVLTPYSLHNPYIYC